MTTPDALRDAEYIADISNFPYDTHDDNTADGSTPEQLDSRLRQRKEIQAKAKTVFLDRLLRDLDLLIYCQLSSLYYMDCSIIQFAIRATIQFAFFTPKSGFEPPKNQPYLGAILASNILCIFLHIVSSAPSAGEVSRGYLHGGLFIDFIGQKGPISKFRLVTFDILVIVLQIVMMGVMLEKERTHAALPRGSADSTSSSSSSATQSGMTQDLDSEERGVHRLDETTTLNNDDIELQNLQSSEAQNDDTQEEPDSERRGLLSDPLTNIQSQLERAVHPRDEFLTGEVVIMNMDFVQTFRDQWRRNSGTTGSSELSDATGAGVSTRVYFRRRFGVHFGANF